MMPVHLLPPMSHHTPTPERKQSRARCGRAVCGVTLVVYMMAASTLKAKHTAGCAGGSVCRPADFSLETTGRNMQAEMNASYSSSSSSSSLFFFLMIYLSLYLSLSIALFSRCPPVFCWATASRCHLPGGTEPCWLPAG